MDEHNAGKLHENDHMIFYLKIQYTICIDHTSEGQDISSSSHFKCEHIIRFLFRENS